VKDLRLEVSQLYQMGDMKPLTSHVQLYSCNPVMNQKCKIQFNLKDGIDSKLYNYSAAPV